MRLNFARATALALVLCPVAAMAQAEGKDEAGNILFASTQSYGTHVKISGATPAKHAGQALAAASNAHLMRDGVQWPDPADKIGFDERPGS